VNKAIVTYATNGHEELLDISAPSYKEFARRHGYQFVRCMREPNDASTYPAAWKKVAILIDFLSNHQYEEVVWFDADMVVVNPLDDFPPMASNPSAGVFTQDKLHSLVRHFEDCSEVPNSGVWRLRKSCGSLEAVDLLHAMTNLEVFTNHGWWEQAALMTLMGYIVPPEGSVFSETKCKCVFKTQWYDECQFMRTEWNSHPNYRADKPRIVHCSYPSMGQRIEVMRALVADPTFNYPRYDGACPHCKRGAVKEDDE
jgi:Nucleotide-diphospho-sugar transferase